MAAKFFTGLPLDGPDPECVLGHGERRWPSRPSDQSPRPRSTTRAGHEPDGPRRPDVRRFVMRRVPLAGFGSTPLTGPG